MKKTLVLLFHPDIDRSRANAAFSRAISEIETVEVVDMHRLYPSGEIDVDCEVRRLLAADRIVLEFPIRWYSTPPLLKAWQDSVLTHMYYLAYETEGRLLEGTPIVVVATAGNVPEAYRAGGVNLFPLEELLRPLEATANRCGLPWSPPILLYEADRLDACPLADAVSRMVGRFMDWMWETGTRLRRQSDGEKELSWG